MNSEVTNNKSKALLAFLRDAASLRRKRIPAYGSSDRILWFGDVPRDRLECRSAFHAENPAEFPDLWLEVRKKRMPNRPPVPDAVSDWLRPQDVAQAGREPELLQEITVLVEKRAPDPDAPDDDSRTLTERVPELRRLRDHPGVEDAWLAYIVNKWDPWAQEMRRWQEVQRAYEDVDFMRRRLEEAEERFELVLAVGLVQWRDSTGSTVKRHLLTAPAEISLDAARGILTVSPAASFEKFRTELDMLELLNQPRLEGAGLDERLEGLDVQAWERSKVGEILRIIANRARPDAQVDENALKPLERADETFRVVYAPALVLRERRPTAYEELVNRLLQASESGSCLSATQPWERFIQEGEGLQNPVEEPSDGQPQAGDGQPRIYFPLPRNEEQQKIAERLQARPYVLVKGPPGTGKSHTIANLICHLLATGERVLVTAQAPKALTVLLDKLPSDIRSLCVSALGSTREDQRLLEDSVRGILSRKNVWKGGAWARREIDRLEQELSQLEGECVAVDRQLRECREAETYPHALFGGYQGTAAQIARQVERDRESHSWFPELADADSRCPLQRAELVFLAEVHGSFNEERLKELRLDVGEQQLPDPRAFAEAVKTLGTAEQSAEAACQGLPPEDLGRLQSFPGAALDTCRAFLSDLENHATRASRVLGDLTGEILRDLLVGREERWSRLAKDVSGLLKSMDAVTDRAGTARVDLPSEADHARLLVDAWRRLDHFRKGGRRGWGSLAPRIARETRYVEERCRVDGQAPRGSQLLERLVAFLESKSLMEQFSQVWPIPAAFDCFDPRRAARQVADLAQELNRLLDLFGNQASDALGVVPVAERVVLAEADQRHKWLRLIEAETASRLALQVRKPLELWLEAVQSFSEGSAHPCMHDFARAIAGRDVAKWKTAWETREDLKVHKKRLDQYQKLVARLEEACPSLSSLLDSSRANPEFRHQLANLDRVWAWAAARAWLRRISDSDKCRQLGRDQHRRQEKIEKKVEELAALKAWKVFFDRLDDRTEQHLTAWTKAVARLGKERGTYAYRHRRAARQYLIACIPRIPAWIMPLHRLWQTIEPTPGIFDTVIVDEASQAGVESLALLLLAKRIIVVGDDKQNTPEAVGILEDDIARLAHDHLREFRFRDEFRPDTSLFDHAERALGNLISLREHFRCVPEIIRFSNDLCYTDAPLIPLRQAPPNRLPALRATFVGTGSCQGEGQQIINYAEADAIAKTIQQCLDDEAYEGKTMGVIVLQGHAQAELIEKKLAETLEPKDREERKLRCGAPATFQGDERDIIFLSLVVAPNHRYRALTGLDYQRRFNVGMSRARDQVWLFHSVQPHDLGCEDLRWKLLNFLHSSDHGATQEAYEELERLEREAKRSPRRPEDRPAPYDSWFELDVALELLRRKYRVRPQWEVAGHPIDLVVEGAENRLAVECDGDVWHGPDRWEHDIGTQRRLERAGWTFVRIRESEFYADREQAVQQILEACGQLGVWPTDRCDGILAGPGQEEAPRRESVGEANDEGTPEEQDADPEPEISSETGSTAGFGPFTGYSSECRFPDPREGSPPNIRAALRQVVENDGPLTRESVYRLYVEGCPGLQRVGKAVRQALSRALGVMLRSGEIVQEDELGGAPDGLVVRLAGAPVVRERSAGRRDLLEIPPSELLLVLSRLCASSPGVPQDDEALARAALEHYGFTRLTERRRRYFTKVLQVWQGKTESSEEGTRQRVGLSFPLFPERSLQ
jgi:very-short-patch-repair endonuclease